MVEKAKNPKKGSISEEEISTLLQRYSATTVLALLQEVAQFPDMKIDWDEMVKNTSTGISNAKEYQMLWRHLAYRHALPDEFGNNAEPLDDDSDLEHELEAFPAVSGESSAEAAAYVKVLIASGLPSKSTVANASIIEAPLIINVPNRQSAVNYLENAHSTCSLEGTNVTIPVFVQKQALPPITPGEALDTNGLPNNNQPPRRKRKKWSKEEDMELIAAVQKCGEGNWATILKGDFKGDRTASQLSQRWATIRKDKDKFNLRGIGSNGSQITEAQLAARRAMSFALDNMPKRPIGSKTSSGHPVLPSATTAALAVGGNTSRFQSQSQRVCAATSQAVGGNASKSLSQPEHVSIPSTSQPQQTLAVTAKARALASMPKLQVNAKKTVTKSSADSMVKAAAVAAGARIATPDDAASLIKSANAVHIMGPGGGSLIKSSLPGCSNPSSSNANYTRASLAVSALSSRPSTTPGATQTAPNQQVNDLCVRTAAPAALHAQACNTAASSKSSDQTHAVPDLVNEVSCSVSAPNSQLLKDQLAQSPTALHRSQMDVVENSSLDMVEKNSPLEMVKNSLLDIDVDNISNEITAGSQTVEINDLDSNNKLELPAKTWDRNQVIENIASEPDAIISTVKES